MSAVEATEGTDPSPPGRARWIAGAVLAPLAFAVLWVAPLPLEAPAHRLVAIFAAVLIAWVTEVVPVAVTALMIGPLLVLCGVTSAATAFRYYADPLLFLFVGGFMLAESMRRHGLDRRFAQAMVTLPFVRGVPLRMQIAMLAAAAVMSMWISNTATCAIMMPILLGMPGLSRPTERSTVDPATGPLLALAYVCSTGGLGTLIGSPPNLITVRLLAEAGVQISFLHWLAIGVPAAFVLTIAVAAITIRRGGKLPAEAMSSPLAAPHAWTRGEKITAFAFVTAVIGWTFPPFADLAGVPFAGTLETLLHPGAVAVVACLPLFLLRDPARAVAGGDTPAVLPWSVAVRIDWGVILLFGGGISLGAQLDQTGLAGVFSSGIVAATGPADVWTLTAVVCVATVFITEVTSNTASANMLVPLVIALARELEVSPVPPALAVGLGASAAFMLPIATGSNALAYGTGRVPQTAMMRSGIVLNLASIVLLLVLLRIICPLMGWV
ncbi:MAG: DASS family sodium-coupled anion symporter [Myxococcota bacterium]|nr:DASS family sodium-coupled anion symporter [Myxococcota bacterium]